MKKRFIGIARGMLAVMMACVMMLPEATAKAGHLGVG